ncbi:hypothetical protein C8024_19010, partial [Sphingopyxis sp. BSNA05]|uniref:beta strand repeat-containing protein n=1 Tax=Sphingopyxis sp. BSNA05 TaxID=1236614 RepID=UPI001566C545
MDGGDGGSGGDATGGTVELIARTGGTISLTSGDFTMTSTGIGGTGANGGNSYDSAAGDAGNGGAGTGGNGRLLAQGGTISGNDLNITTTGQGGDGGTRGYYGAFGTNGAQGTGGAGTGGTGIAEIQEGSPGILAFANVTMDSSGTGGGGPIGGIGAGGRIEIADSSTDPAGLISFDSLTATAFDTAIGTGTGSASALSGGFFVTGDSGAISILGDLTVNVAGNIQYDFDADGQMTVGGNATLTSGQNIFIDHSNNGTPVNSIDVSGNFAATAQGDFISTAGSRINAAGTASVRTGQNATVADIAGVGLVDISAMWDANVTNAAVTGTVTTVTLGAGTFVLGPQLLIQAGHDPMGTPSAVFDPSYNATLDGDVTSAGFITVNAGGSALFATGSSTISDNGLTVQTGDDIIIQTGASLVAGNNAATSPNTANPFPDTNNLILQAGALTPLSSTPVTPIASIVAAGDIDANDFAVVMSANAIDGLGGTITASSLSVDINDAPSNAVIAGSGQSDDNGLLSAQCVEGNVCLGTLNADNLVYIGQASNNDVVQGIIESGTVSANDILVTTRRDIIMGTDGIATVLDASNQFLVESTEGDVDLRDASVASASVLVSAVNGSLLGSGNLDSSNDVGITVGADISAASITAGGQLTTVALVGGASESLYTVPGSIDVNSYTQGTAQRFRVEAGNDISFGQITIPDNAIELVAAQSGPGDVFLGNTNGASSIVLQGENVGFLSLDATVSGASGIILTATSGNISGGDAVASSAIDLDATDDIAIGSLSTLQAITLDAGGNIAFADASGAGITINSGQDILFDTINATGTATLTATGGTIGVNNAGADITATGAGQGINLFADNVDVGALTTNSGDILISAAQDIALGSAATGTGTPTAASIGLLAGDNIAATGALRAGEDISIRSLGDVALASVSAGDDILVQADGAITLDSATTSGAGIDLFALSFNTANAGLAGSIAFGSETSPGSNIQLTSGGNVTATAALNAHDDIVVTATGTPNLANAISGGDTSISGAAVSLNNGTIGGNLTIDASAGDIDGTGTVTVGGGIDLDATGNIGFGDLDAQGGTFTVDAGNAINFTSATSADAISMTAGGSISGGDLTAVNALNLDGGNIAIGDASAINISFNSGSNILFDSLASTNGIALTASGGTIGVNSTGGDITVSGLGASLNLVADNVDVGALTTNGGDILISAAQDIALGSAATGTGTPTAASIGLLAGGNIAATGALRAGEDISIRSLGDVALASVSAGDDFLVQADGAITLDDATTSGAGIDLFALVFDTANAGQAGSIAFGSETSPGSNIRLTSGGNVTATGALDASDDIIVSATGTPTLANAISGGNTSITGASVALNNGTIGGDLTLNATTGDVDGSGSVTVGGGIDLDATGDVGFGDLEAQGGSFT